MFGAKFRVQMRYMSPFTTQAKSSITSLAITGLRTLPLKNSPTGVNITLFSDNVATEITIHNIEFTDFCKEYPSAITVEHVVNIILMCWTWLRQRVLYRSFTSIEDTKKLEP